MSVVSVVSSHDAIEKKLKMKLSNTPPKFSIAPEKWWLEDYFPIGVEGNFSGAMLNFGRINKSQQPQNLSRYLLDPK